MELDSGGSRRKQTRHAGASLCDIGEAGASGINDASAGEDVARESDGNDGDDGGGAVHAR